MQNWKELGREMKMIQSNFLLTLGCSSLRPWKSSLSPGDPSPCQSTTAHRETGLDAEPGQPDKRLHPGSPAECGTRIPPSFPSDSNPTQRPRPYGPFYFSPRCLLSSTDPAPACADAANRPTPPDNAFGRAVALRPPGFAPKSINIINLIH